MPGEVIATKILEEKIQFLSFGFWLRIQKVRYPFNGKETEKYSVCLFLGDKIVFSYWKDGEVIEKDKIRQIIKDLGGCRATPA